MSERNRIKEGTFTVFFMCAITFVAISVVAAIHLATADIVARNETLFLKRAIADAAGAGPFSDAGAVLSWYDAAVQPVPSAEAPDWFRVARAERADACVFVRTGAGLWGDITAVAGLEQNLQAFTGVTFVKHNETPGLGARIDEPWFQTQFVGKSGPFELVAEKTQSPDPKQIDAITGATITSGAVRDIMNGLLKDAPGLVREQMKDSGKTARVAL